MACTKRSPASEVFSRCISSELLGVLRSSEMRTNNAQRTARLESNTANILLIGNLRRDLIAFAAKLKPNSAAWPTQPLTAGRWELREGVFNVVRMTDGNESGGK